jgi:hypothetical protein
MLGVLARDELSPLLRLMTTPTTSKLRSVKVKGAGCMVYPLRIWYFMCTFLVSWLRVSFWMITDFPAALAKGQTLGYSKDR